MAYRDDILALGADHHWDFDGDSLDQIGSVNGTDSGVDYAASAITEDATNCMRTNAVADVVTLPTTANINNSAQTRKAVAGWFVPSAIQTPPKRVYGEGNDTTSFQFVLSFGNTVMFEVIEPTNFDVQIFSDVILQPGRTYHLCGIFEGNGYANEARFYIDGVEQLSAVPSNRQPASADLDARGVGEFGGPAGTVGIGGEVIVMDAPVDGSYQHWITFDGANAVLTDTEVKEELFEKGALPGTTIAAGTQSAMQTSLDALIGTVRQDEPLNIRVSTVTGDGNLSLVADNITHNALASINVQYMGTGTLTWINANGSNASLGSTPNGGVIVFATRQTLTVTAKDAVSGSAILNARVYIEADTGGDLAAGTVIMNTLTDGSGVATVSFDYTNDQPILAWARQGSTPTYYKHGVIGGPLTSTPLNAVVLLVSDG